MYDHGQPDPRFRQTITSKEQLRDLLGEPRDTTKAIRLAQLDTHCRRIIELSPMVMLGTTDSAGRTDVSPKGDPAGFVRVVDDKTLVLPDRPGNRMADSLMNLLDNPYAALLFLVPGMRETLRVEGNAQLVTDPELLDTLKVDGKAPRLAVVVHVEKAFVHCAKCMIRSGLWKPETWPAAETLPRAAQVLKDHGEFEHDVDAIEDYLETGNRKHLY